MLALQLLLCLLGVVYFILFYFLYFFELLTLKVSQNPGG